MERLRLFGAAGGAVFAVLVVIAFAIAPGPSNAHGDTVVEYYSAHGTAVAWEAGDRRRLVVLFIWFAGTFAGFLSAGSAAVVGAAVTAALYLVAIGCWEALGETSPASTSRRAGEARGRPRTIRRGSWRITSGAHHDRGLFGSTAVAILTSGARWSWLGWIGIGFPPISLIGGVIVLASESHWSDALGTVVFLAFSPGCSRRASGSFSRCGALRAWWPRPAHSCDACVTLRPRPWSCGRSRPSRNPDGSPDVPSPASCQLRVPRGRASLELDGAPSSSREPRARARSGGLLGRWPPRASSSDGCNGRGAAAHTPPPS